MLVPPGVHLECETSMDTAYISHRTQAIEPNNTAVQRGELFRMTYLTRGRRSGEAIQKVSALQNSAVVTTGERDEAPKVVHDSPSLSGFLSITPAGLVVHRPLGSRHPFQWPDRQCDESNLSM